MTNRDVAQALYEIADLLELKGEDPFKIRAYRKAAEAVELLLEEIADLAAKNRLQAISGIGKAIGAKIQELLATGQIEYLEDLRRAIPPGVRALTRVPGLGARTAELLYTRLGIDSLDRLELAARQGLLRDLPGWGARKEAAILDALAKFRERGERVPLGAVRPVAGALAEYLLRHPAVRQAEVAGSIRRRRDTVEDIDLVVATDDSATVLAYVADLPIAGEIIGQAPDRIAMTTTLGRRMDVIVVPPAAFARTLLLMTGADAHIRELGDIPDAPTEAAIYQRLGLPFIEPELREGLGEIQAALAGRLPRLVTVQALKGDLHTHTRASDGTATLQEMAEAARSLGHQYLAICDHSRSLSIAGGLTPERLALQGNEIRRLNQTFSDFRLLRGTEVDILRDGSLDFPDDVLADLDVVVASIHSHMHLDSHTQTERLLRAIHNPHVDIIGHPTGRILGRRDPYPLDIDRIIAACAETGTALEISASPARLDLSELHARLARQRGVKLVINTDAHSTLELQGLEHGVGQARRAWLEVGDVINALPLPNLLAWLNKEKRSP
ncbi:MAG: DNA-dependent polymerase family [Symbiobacteriaceae bacterium]|jgi:DNA polymerase (family 10)|nr:DNA-dependent polymerase family [Symbiobacteriaceae bacterium]